MLTDRKEIEQWLNEYEITDYSIEASGEVYCYGDVDIPGSRTRKLKGVLPVKFSHARNFDVSNNELTSMEGFPTIILGSFHAKTNRFTNFQHSPKRVGGDYNVRFNKIESLVGIANHIEMIGHTIELSNNPITSGGLGLFDIDRLFKIQWGGTGRPGVVVNIIRKYLDDHENIFQCQEELISRGFDKFAVI